MVEVAKFTPRAPVNLFERARRSLGTTLEDTLIAPPLYAEVSDLGRVKDLRASTAIITALAVSNTSGEARRVEFQVRSARRITYQAEVVAGPGENWLRLDRVTRPTGSALFGYDWTQDPPVRLTDEPEQTGAIMRSVTWRSDGLYVAAGAATGGARFAVYDAQDEFSQVFLSDPSVSPARVLRCEWSPDGQYLAVVYDRAFTDGVYLRVWDFSQIDEPVEVTIPDVTDRITRTPTAVSWGGPDGRYLVIGRPGPDRFGVWDWASGAPVYSDQISGIISDATAGTARAVAFSPNPNQPRLSVSHTGGDLLTVFDWADSETPVKIDNPVFAENTASIPERRGLAWSADGNRLGVLSSRSTAIPFTAYSFLGGISVLPDPGPLPPLPTLRTLGWSPDGRYLVIGHTESTRYTYYPVALPYLLVYDYESGFPVRAPIGASVQGVGRVDQLEFSPDGASLLIAGMSYDRFYPPTGVDNVRLFDPNGVDQVVNGSFEDTTGMTRESFGFSAKGEIVGWFTDQEPRETVTLRFPNRRFVNAFPTNGNLYLDLVATGPEPVRTNNARLRQNFGDLVEGQTYRLAVDVTASINSTIGLEVLWNGEPVEIAGETTLPIVEDFPLVAMTVPPGQTMQAPVERSMLAFGDNLQGKANGGGVDCVVSYILSTQDALETITDPPDPDPEEEEE